PALQPFGERPVTQLAGSRELYELGARSGIFSATNQGGNPETPDHRPDPAVVVLPLVVLAVPAHVVAPQAAVPANRPHHGAHRVRIVHSSTAQCANGALTRAV